LPGKSLSRGVSPPRRTGLFIWLLHGAARAKTALRLLKLAQFIGRPMRRNTCRPLHCPRVFPARSAAKSTPAIRSAEAAWGREDNEADQYGSVYASENGGKTWRPIKTESQHVYNLTIDAQHPDTLYVTGFDAVADRSRRSRCDLEAY
jgi:hypothetical protein